MLYQNMRIRRAGFSAERGSEIKDLVHLLYEVEKRSHWVHSKRELNLVQCNFLICKKA